MRSMAAVNSLADPEPSLAEAARAACTRRAELITALEGTHPKLRQSPPMRWRSTMATFAPSPAPMAALTSPPVPAPTTTRW